MFPGSAPRVGMKNFLRLGSREPISALWGCPSPGWWQIWLRVTGPVPHSPGFGEKRGGGLLHCPRRTRRDVTGMGCAAAGSGPSPRG